VRGSSDVLLRRVILTGMHGDGVQLIGLLNPTISWVDGVRIVDCLFTHNGRSGIAVQRAVRDVKVIGNRFTRIMDQAIDMEPSDAGPDNLGPRDFEILNNRFYDTATLALTITGISNGDPARNVLVANNEFDGTGIFVFNAVDIRIEGNAIRSGEKWAPIEVRKRSQRIVIQSNVIDSRGTEGSAAIVLTYHTSEAPKYVSVMDNTILTGEYDAYFARDAEGLRVTGNMISGYGNGGINIQDVNPDSPLRDFLVENNTISGYRIGVRFASREDPMRDVCIRNNIITEVSDELLTKGPVRRGCD
jgi:hypothetical protein